MHSSLWWGLTCVLQGGRHFWPLPTGRNTTTSFLFSKGQSKMVLDIAEISWEATLPRLSTAALVLPDQNIWV